MADILALFFYFSPGLGTVMLLWFVGAVLFGAFVEFLRRLTGEKWTWDDFFEKFTLAAMIGIGGAAAGDGEGGWEGGGFGDPGGFGGFGGGLSGGGGAGGKW